MHCHHHHDYANRPKRLAIAKGMRSSFDLLCQLGMNVLVSLLRHFSFRLPLRGGGRFWTAVSLMQADSACPGALAGLAVACFCLVFSHHPFSNLVSDSLCSVARYTLSRCGFPMEQHKMAF
jgi:hypothetical protein